MTREEFAGKCHAVPEATNEEIAGVFADGAIWDFEPSYHKLAKVALVAAQARGLTVEDLIRMGWRS